MPKNQSRKLKSPASPVVQLHSEPHQAADELDATMYFLHKRYQQIDSEAVPQLPNFLISRLDVKFSDVERVMVEKHWEKRTIDAVAPRVAKEREDEMRLHLHTLYSPMLVRCQVRAISDIHQMLFGALDARGKHAIMKEYRDYRNRLKKADHQSLTRADGDKP